MSEKELDLKQYLDDLEPLNHPREEEDVWQQHYQNIIDHPERYSDRLVYVAKMWRQVEPRYRRKKYGKRT